MTTRVRPTNRIFINSLPKSGTHLLAKAAALFGYVEHFDPDNLDDPTRITPLFFNYREVKDAIARMDAMAASTGASEEHAIYVGTLTPVYANTTHFRRWFAAMPAGSYILGHVGYAPELSSLLADLNVRHLFIIRDPRAVIVSLRSFILDTRGMPRPHFLQEDFNEMSPTQRLDMLLEGGYAPRAGVHVTPFADVYRTMLAWHNDPNCLLLHFEELVGPQGGGTIAQQRTAIERIAEHLGRSGGDVTDQLDAVFDTSSRTFRTGQIDGWQREVDTADLARLDAYCAPLCQLAGYEVSR